MICTGPFSRVIHSFRCQSGYENYLFEIVLVLIGTKVEEIHLESWQYQYSELVMDGPVISMTLTKQESKKTDCLYGTNFGFEGCRLWVDKGARGWFKVKYIPSPIKGNLWISILSLFKIPLSFLAFLPFHLFTLKLKLLRGFFL